MRLDRASHHRLASLSLLAVAAGLAAPSTASADVAYVRSTVGQPWNSNTNEEAMDLEFGVGGWDDLRYETLDPMMLFSPTYTFIYMDGSDDNASELQAFLAANQAALEMWVMDGGRLFLNAGPNEGGNQAWGFGGITLNYPDFPNDPGMAVDPLHPIWNGPHLPTAVMFTGGSYAHATVSGPGLIDHVIDSDGGNPNLAELPVFGLGAVMFGGFTTSNFWDPNPESLNLRANIIAYMAGPADADMDGILDPSDNCPLDPNPMQEDMDADMIGDVCDICPMDPLDDVDMDTVCGDVDNCPDDANEMQEDADMDGQGDVCDVCPGDPDDDIDGDMICGDEDNCPDDINVNQADADMDGDGDACDVCPDDPDNDEDGDMVCFAEDNCPDVANEDQADEDGDGIGDACDDPPAGTTGGDETGGDETADGGSGMADTGVDPDTGGGPGGADGSTSGAGGDTGGGTTDDPGQDDPGGCGCVAGSSENRAGWSLLALFAMVGLRRRRRAA